MFLGPATTLAVSPYSSFDPINLIKLIFVTSLAFSIVGLCLFQLSVVLSRIEPAVAYLSLIFIGWMLVSMFVSDAPLNQQFWGVFGRNTGFLTYLSLVLVMIGVALVQQKPFYRKLVEVLILTAVPTTLYALIQVAGRDPVPWSLKAPFATLGNINFSSAFFGLTSLCCAILAFTTKLAIGYRILFVLLAATDLLIVLQTGSIQGFMIFVAGIGVAGYWILRDRIKSRALHLVYLLLGFVGFVLTALSLANIGPLARFVFGETISFRYDYWYAGWQMTVKNPFFGLGMDSYGDWYRELRGETATLRTTPDRITNTAHNIYLDISSSGGFPLLFAYLAIILWTVRLSLRKLRRDKELDPYFLAMFSAWIAYLIQAAVSINQVGVGIWGWLFTGGLIGYERATRESSSLSKESKGRTAKSVNQLPASAALLGLGFFAIGFVLAFIPFSADAKYKVAAQTNSPAEIASSVNRLGSTAFHYSLALDSAIKAEDVQLASKLASEVLRKYPRDFFALQVTSILTTSTVEQREFAQNKLRELDPFNPQFKQP